LDPAYPYYWGYPGYIGTGIIAAGVAFGAAYALGRWATGGYWGSGGWWGGSRVNWAAEQSTSIAALASSTGSMTRGIDRGRATTAVLRQFPTQAQKMKLIWIIRTGKSLA
jgi:hypothetical protein